MENDNKKMVQVIVGHIAPLECPRKQMQHCIKEAMVMRLKIKGPEACILTGKRTITTIYVPLDMELVKAFGLLYQRGLIKPIRLTPSPLLNKRPKN